MKKFALILILSLALSACGDNIEAGSISKLEKKVTRQALSAPETSINIFLDKIETAGVEEQGVYMYGMAVAREKMGDNAGALNDYLAAEALGNQSARVALSDRFSDSYSPQP